MTTRKTITVTDQQDEWIKAQIGAGSYTNDSEYIRDLIRKDQDRHAKIAAMQKLIDEAEGERRQPAQRGRDLGRGAPPGWRKCRLGSPVAPRTI